MKNYTLLGVIIFLFQAAVAQTKFTDDIAYELYLQKIANTEVLMVLKNYRDARAVFNSIDYPAKGLEYYYLNAKLNQSNRSQKIHTNSATALAISNDGKTLATGGDDSTIHLLNSNDFVRMESLKGHNGTVTALDFNGNGNWLVSGSTDKTVNIWDVKTKSVVKQLSHPEWNRIYDVNFNPDDSKLGVTTWTFVNGKVKGIIHLFSTDTWELIEILESPSPHPVSSIDFSPDGNGVVYGTWGLSAHYYDFIQRNIKWALNMMDNFEYSSITSLEVSPDNQFVLIGSKDTKVRLVDRAGSIVFEPQPYQWHGHEVNDVTFHPSGKYFASASIDQSINLGNTNSGELISTLLGRDRSVNEIVFHPSGKELFSISSDGYITGWNLAEKQTEIFRGCPDPGYGRGLFTTTVDRGGKRVAMACGQKVMVWDITTLEHFELDVATYYGLEFVDNQLLVGERDGMFSSWDLTTKKMIHRVAAHDSYIQKVEYIGNSRALTASGKLIKLWDMKSNKMLKSYEAPAFIQSFAAFKKNGTVMLTLSGGKVLVLDLKSFEIQNQWTEKSTASRIALAPDENKFAFGHTDGRIGVYETQSYKPIAEVRDVDGGIASLCFDHSGNNLVSTTSSNSKTLKFWNVQTSSKTLSLHDLSDIAFVTRIGADKRFLFADKRGKVFIVRY